VTNSICLTNPDHYPLAVCQNPGATPITLTKTGSQPYQDIDCFDRVTEWSGNAVSGYTCVTRGGINALRITTFHVNCGETPTERDPQPLGIETACHEDPPCLYYNWYFTTCNACVYPDKCSNTLPSRSSSKALSGGGIFLIIFFVGLFVYCIAGAAYNYKQHHATGTALIPHRDLWFGLPGLVKDGCIFSAQSVMKMVHGINGHGEGYVKTF